MKKRLTIKKGAVALIFAVFAFSFVKQIDTLQSINEQIETGQEELSELEETNQKLQAEVDSAQTGSDYIEKLARDRLGLIKDGEIVVESSESQG